MPDNQIIYGDSLKELQKIDRESVDLIYLDPPFFTQEIKKQKTRNNDREYYFKDKWNDINSYLDYMEQRLRACKDVLKETGSIFLHCDRNAAHYLKILMDQIFEIENFQSEIIWYYRRWSNSKKGLLNNHQVIFFYSKTKQFKFNKMYTEYSVTTNIDQILQDRVRDHNGKAIYKTDEDGEHVIGNSKKGVPLSDVWEIPYLNPKAKERSGYPTQKPIILLEQIIKLVTEEGDVVLDPFMGSGTALVAAKLLNRQYIGIDISLDAVELTNRRLNELIKTESFLLQKGKNAYQNLSDAQMQILKSLHAIPVQRNSGIDGFLDEYIDGKPVSVKIQNEKETLSEAIEKLVKSSKRKRCEYMILVRTHLDLLSFFDFSHLPDGLIMIEEYNLQIKHEINKLQKHKERAEA